MDQKQINRLEELRWLNERKAKQALLEQKLKQIILDNAYLFLSYEDSDNIQLSTHSWPDDKWINQLYIQIEIGNPNPIKDIISRFIDVNGKDISYLFFMNYNFGFVQVNNEILSKHWADFVEIDGDQIFCFIPERPEFICIEKTEDVIIGKANDVMQWIYEVTFSSKSFRDELQNSSR